MRVTKAALRSASKSDMTALVDSMQSSTKNLSTKITAFISSSTDKLVGEGYNAVRKKLSQYSDILQKASEVCLKIGEDIVNANNKLLNYMDEYTYLDDSEKEKINGEIQRSQRILAELEREITIYEKRFIGYRETKTTFGSASSIAYWKNVIANLNKYYKKLEGLASADESAFSVLEGNTSNISGLSNACSAINPTVFKDLFLNLANNGVVNRNRMFNNYVGGGFNDDAKIYNGYSINDMKNMSSVKLQQMANENEQEYIKFVAACAMAVYIKNGCTGCLPSITVAQSLQETGHGKNFHTEYNNIYGFRCNPYGDLEMINRFAVFDNIYEATVYHQTYFYQYPDVTTNFLKLCDADDATGAAGKIGLYDGGAASYSQACVFFVNSSEYDIRKYDQMARDIAEKYNLN